MAGVTVTVAICTFRRPAALAAGLQALALQDDPGFTWDVLVVDNERPPGAAPVFDRHGGALGVSARLVREEVPGSAAARNRVIAESEAEVTALLDDDVAARPGWLKTLLGPVLAGRADGAGGPVLLDPAVPRPAWFDEEGIGGYLARFDPASVERPLAPEEYVSTANAAFRTAVLRRTGGFDPALGPRGRSPVVNDDVLVSRRFLAAGGRLRYVPGAVVVHQLPPERLRPGYLLRRAYAQGRSDWLLEREQMARRRLGGARVAVGGLAAESRRRAREGLWRRCVAFHAACDAARAAGALREALALALRSP